MKAIKSSKTLYKFVEGFYIYLICPKCLCGYKFNNYKLKNKIPLSTKYGIKVMIDEIPEEAYKISVPILSFDCNCMNEQYEILKYNHLPTYSIFRMRQINYNIIRNLQN